MGVFWLESVPQSWWYKGLLLDTCLSKDLLTGVEKNNGPSRGLRAAVEPPHSCSCNLHSCCISPVKQSAGGWSSQSQIRWPWHHLFPSLCSLLSRNKASCWGLRNSCGAALWSMPQVCPHVWGLHQFHSSRWAWLACSVHRGGGGEVTFPPWCLCSWYSISQTLTAHLSLPVMPL